MFLIYYKLFKFHIILILNFLISQQIIKLHIFFLNQNWIIKYDFTKFLFPYYFKMNIHLLN